MKRGCCAGFEGAMCCGDGRILSTDVVERATGARGGGLDFIVDERLRSCTVVCDGTAWLGKNSGRC